MGTSSLLEIIMHPTATPANHRRGRGHDVLALTAGLLACLSVCACDLRFDREEVHVHYDADADTLDLLLVYRGLRTEEDSSEHLDKAMKVLPPLLEGRRQFMILAWPLYWDLDELQQDIDKTLATAHADQDKALTPAQWQEKQDRARRFGQLIEHFEMRDQGLFLEPGEQLSGFQWIRVKQVSKALERANALISEAMLESIESDDWTDDEDFDARTLELWEARARSQEPWFGIDARGLTIDLPLSAARSRAYRRAGLLGLASSEEEDMPAVHILAELAVELRSLEFSSEGATAIFGGQRPGRLSLDLDDPDMEPSSPLLERVRAAGLPIDLTRTLEQVRALVGIAGGD